MKKLSRIQKIITITLLIPLLISMVAGFMCNWGINPLATGGLIFMAYVLVSSPLISLWCGIKECTERSRNSAQAIKPKTE